MFQIRSIVFLYCCLIASHVACLHLNSREEAKNIETWTGKWFPNDPSASTTESEIERMGVVMGISKHECDDATTNLQMDWLDDEVNYTCIDQRYLYEPNYDIKPIHEEQEIPPMYKAMHLCMDKPIVYNEDVPLFGTHRPLWGQWGEYTFLPKQRWLHNLEHGGIVMLYHPCANKREVNRLRKLVTGCIYKHIITPYNLLSADRPLVLLAWGHKLSMSVVSKEVVQNFIMEYALHGPEGHYSKNGQYEYKLINKAAIVSNNADDVLCPNST